MITAFRIVLILVAAIVFIIARRDARDVQREIDALKKRGINPRHGKEYHVLLATRRRIIELSSAFIALLIGAAIMTAIIGCGNECADTCGGYYGERAGTTCLCHVEDDIVAIPAE